jgi:hypothetical protein
MKRLMVLVILVLVVVLGSYGLFAQQGGMPQAGGGDMMGGMNAGMMGDMMGMMGGMQTAIAATSDGGVVVAAGGKLIKYNALLKKVAEVDIDVDWDAMSKKMQQNCPMTQMMK